MDRKFVASVFLIIASIILLCIFLFGHLELGLARYIDVDEFAHLHWASHMAMGEKPYIDFLYFFPPGYQWFLEPIFWIFQGVTPIIAARVVAFIVFVGLVAITIAIFFFMRRRLWAAIFAGALLAYLPLPYDKFIEIRPDTLAAFFTMIGVSLQIYASKNHGSEITSRAGVHAYRSILMSVQFWSGIFYAVSLIVLPKSVPVIAFACILFGIQHRDSFHISSSRSGIPYWRSFGITFVYGLFAPLILFGLWILTLGNIQTVLYSLTRLPIEANKISQTFFMSPDLFFYPNETFYGTAGYSVELIANHIVWGIALLVGIVSLFAPFRTNRLSDAYNEILIAGIFLIHVYLYVEIVPLKHAQYLIPIAPFIAYYAADFMRMIWDMCSRISNGMIGFTVGFFVITILLLRLHAGGLHQKMTWTNAQTLAELRTIFQSIPKTEPILDLDGRTLYYPDPYFACCLPFGQSAPYLSRPLPSLSETLEAKKVKYIYQGELKRVGTLLQNDQAYINDHYANWDTDGKMLVRK